MRRLVRMRAAGPGLYPISILLRRHHSHRRCRLLRVSYLIRLCQQISTHSKTSSSPAKKTEHPSNQLTHSKTSSSAAKKTEHPTDQPMFIRPKGPPPGFEHLVNQVEYGPADVFYDDILLGSVDVEFNQDWVKLSDPKNILAQLEGIKDSAKVLKALTGKLKTNTSYLCRPSQKQQIECNILYPKIAAVIFDPQNFKVRLFIHRKYLSTWGKSASYLGPSTSGISYMNHLSAVMAGSRDDYVYNDQYTNTYTLTSLGTLAFKTSKLTMDADFTRNSTDDRNVSLQVPKPQEFHINKIDATFYRGRYLTDAGMLDSKGNHFVTQQKILGLRFGTHLESLLNRSLADSTPIIVSMDQRSQVKVYKEGRLIYAGFYSAGNHRLDTSNWPGGAYDVQIKVISPAGQAQQESRFFVKTNEIAPLGHPQYYVGAGFLADQLTATSIDRPILPQYSHVPLFEAGYNQRLSQHWGFSESLVGTMNRGYLTSGLYWLSRYWVIEPGLLLSNDKDIGGNLNIRANIGHFSMNFNGTEIAGSDTRENQSVTDFDPITLDSRRLSVNMSYHVKSLTVNLFSAMTRGQRVEYRKRFGLTCRYKLFYKHGMSSYLSFDFRNEDKIKTYMLTLSLGYNKRSWTANVSADWQKVHDPYVNNNVPNAVGGDAGLVWEKDTRELDEQHIRSSIDTHFDNKYTNQRAGLYYTNRLGGINLNVMHSKAKMDEAETKSWQYTALMATNFIYAQHLMLMSGFNNPRAGIVISTNGFNKPDSTFEVLVNNQTTYHVNLRRRRFINLEPYKRYKVVMMPASVIPYSYDKKPRYVTLYPGNIQRMNWAIKKNFYLLTQVFYPNGAVVRSASVAGSKAFNIIDSSGEMQAELDSSIRVLRVKPRSGPPCRIYLPNLDADQEFVILKSIICHPDNDQISAHSVRDKSV
jgi:Mat/Ecp fimbriae outer membrane usher protein